MALRRVSSNFERMYVATRLPDSIRSNPCRFRISAYSASSRAPAIQPVQRSISRRPSSLTGFWMVTSAICILPPGRRTRKISENTASLSGTRSITPFEITTPTLSFARGSRSISPSKKLRPVRQRSAPRSCSASAYCSSSARTARPDSLLKVGRLDSNQGPTDYETSVSWSTGNASAQLAHVRSRSL
jgi:hypothetical protein